MTDEEMRCLARDALANFDEDHHYIVTFWYFNGTATTKKRCWCSSFDALDECIDSILDDDVIDLEVRSTSMDVEDFEYLCVHIDECFPRIY